MENVSQKGELNRHTEHIKTETELLSVKYLFIYESKSPPWHFNILFQQPRPSYSLLSNCLLLSKTKFYQPTTAPPLLPLIKPPMGGGSLDRIHPGICCFLFFSFYCFIVFCRRFLFYFIFFFVFFFLYFFCVMVGVESVKRKI